MGAADRGRGGLGEAEVAQLAGLHEFADGAGDVLDRHVGVDAVLLEQVDGASLQSAQRRVSDPFDLLGTAVKPTEGPFSMRHPKVTPRSTAPRSTPIMASRSPGLGP
ncbi:hypothetical protein ACFFX1_37075 [Dactylosporangium sucinum]|uniref:hypothetical protein n=1 Tax=Dactylosporangium sucinum TaxID=1424081 RepID=UPI00227CBC43|nr:hypothetical protein [Dactylosporangium sucinum]